MTNEDAFVLRAIDSGAVAAFGHMRLSQGFPHLYTVLESWTRGENHWPVISTTDQRLD